MDHTEWHLAERAHTAALNEGCDEGGPLVSALAKLLDDEPPGAGDDPYGRPDPIKHPEFWTE